MEEDTVVMGGKQESGQKSEKISPKDTWRQVAIGGGVGVLSGAGASVALNAATNHEVPVVEPDLAPESPNGVEAAIATEAPTTVEAPAAVDGTVGVATVPDGMSFGDAFLAAREQVGAGGVFVWNGQVYHTYTADEWNAMSEAEHAQFGNRINVVYAGQPPVQEPDVVVVYQQEGAGPQVGHASPDTGHPMAQPAIQQTTGAEVEPEVEVLECGTVTNDDGSQMDVAVVSVNGEEVGVIDVNQDGVADVMAADVNGNGTIDQGEIADVSSEGIQMQPLQDQYLAQNDPALQGPDYVNDGDVTSYTV